MGIFDNCYKIIKLVFGFAKDTSADKYKQVEAWLKEKEKDYEKKAKEMKELYEAKLSFLQD